MGVIPAVQGREGIQAGGAHDCLAWHLPPLFKLGSDCVTPEPDSVCQSLLCPTFLSPSGHMVWPSGHMVCPSGHVGFLSLSPDV